ncbi:MAG: dipeptide ABC transporter ATP-binding protein [Pseudomonadota bacterium]
MSLFEAQDLSVSLGSQEFVRRVSFSIGAGKVFGLVGESGSGKSLTALSVMGLLPSGMQRAGSITLERRRIDTLDERGMCALRGREIGMIFQEPMTALNPLKTIGDQVAETLVIHGAAGGRQARDLARAALARVGLPDDKFPLTRFPHELSGGQRQRVAIAMAIVLEPQLLIADEPTTALDVTTQAQILDLIRGLVRERGMSCMLITHDLAVVAGLADHVAVMQNGQIVEAGPTEPVFRRRHHPYTDQLIRASAFVPPRLLAEPGAPILAAEGVRRSYRLPREGLRRPLFRAVDGVDLTIGKGESVGLVGESGCGKSTLTRALLGLEHLQGGRVVLDGQEVPKPANVGPAMRRKMQVVFQDPFGSFNPRHKVLRLVAEPLYLFRGAMGDHRKLVGDVLRAVGLTADDMEKYIHEFSGGQRQRIAIARALITRPDLILLDEAVSALDVQVRAQILDLLTRLRSDYGLSYLFVSHDLSVVRAITDRVYVMKAGRIVEEGPTWRVFSVPREAYTKELIAATPKIPDDWLREDTA